MSISMRQQKLTLSNKGARACWYLVYWSLFRLTPTPLHSWRAFVLRCFGARIGKRVKIYASAKIWAPWNLSMGDDSCMGPGVDCYCVDRIDIQARAIVSQRSFLCTASHDYQQPGLPLVTAPIRIERDAWVTAEVYVGPGVTFHAGAVALARAVVVKDVPAWAVVAGNPAVQVRMRAERIASAHD
ncbi:MAG: putative colanic acid biosynthesis acetyltransferase [Ramlibacter sp.]|nr:putative colanic acid biosynthesis acetyltransferase [Ramlibacter sp.]